MHPKFYRARGVLELGNLFKPKSPIDHLGFDSGSINANLRELWYGKDNKLLMALLNLFVYMNLTINSSISAYSC